MNMESIGDSMTPQCSKTPVERQRDDLQQSSPSSESNSSSSSSSSPPAELSTRNALRKSKEADRRKTRKKLLQHYKQLSSISQTRSKKMDKACILEEALAYLKQLQERVTMLEEQAKNTSVTFGADQTYEQEALLEIDTIVEEKNVMIKIECVKQKGYTAKILTKIEKLHLSIVSFSSFPFGNNLLAITIYAQMDDEFCMTTKDLKSYLQLSITSK